MLIKRGSPSAFNVAVDVGDVRNPKTLSSKSFHFQGQKLCEDFKNPMGQWGQWDLYYIYPDPLLGTLSAFQRQRPSSQLIPMCMLLRCALCNTIMPPSSFSKLCVKCVQIVEEYLEAEYPTSEEDACSISETEDDCKGPVCQEASSLSF